MSHELDIFGFDLPESLIAKTPATARDQSRLMVVTPHQILDHKMTELIHFLRPTDCLIMNDTRVMKARLLGKKITGASIQIMLIKPGKPYWEALVKPAKRVRIGERLWVSDDLSIEIVDWVHHPSHHPLAVVALHTQLDPIQAIETHGQLPLPPYLHQIPTASDEERYQTLMATQLGSVAAPTAGLHFSEDLLFKIRSMGVSIHTITLHIGYGTFQPILSHDIRDHHMHEEWYHIPDATADAIHTAKASGHRVVAVGTTVTRALESAWQNGRLRTGPQTTSIFLTPGVSFKVVSALVTNFHLPKSSLFILVCALMGIQRIKVAYEHAIQSQYRFYSYGDATFLCPLDE